jgi:hypothetical protein
VGGDEYVVDNGGESCDEDRDFTMYLDAYATHMFKTHQWLEHLIFADKPLSRLHVEQMKFAYP